MPDRAMAAQTALLRRRFRPAWSAPEDMIVERFTRAFVSGRFSSLTGVARPCKKALDRLHARHPDKPWATFPRTRQAVRGRITQRLNAAGDTWTSADFLPREQRAFDRYVREFLKGRFAHLNLAARDCWRELRRQADVVRRREFGLTGTPAPRSLKAVASQLELRTRALGRPPLSHRWSRNEFRTVDKWMRRYFAALERGTGPSEREVLGAMARELESRGYPRRPAQGYRGAFEKRMKLHPRARQRPGRRWVGAELAKARRWAQRCLAARRTGREFFITEAARRLRAELARQGLARSQRGCEGIVERFVRPRSRT